MELAIGLIIGLMAGAGITYFVTRKTSLDASAMAESIGARMVSQQAEQILQLAETKLSGKKEVIDATLQGMSSKLVDVETLMRSIGEGNVAIGTKLTNAAVVIKDLTENTSNLKNALASNSARGQWGERMAEDVLRLSGMIEGINFIKQKKIESVGSKPDFTFLLPQNLKLNMDVKFPYNNYQAFTEAKSEREKEDCKKKFLSDVRKRVKELQTRDYINAEEQTVDYVLLFVPNEQIFGFINEMDRDLIDEALRAKTILCSPLSLYAILAIIRQSIDNFRLESKSKEMLSLFGTFQEEWSKFKGQMKTVKDRLDTLQNGYEDLIGKRERQLDRPLAKIEELRMERGIEPAVIEEASEKAARKQMVSSARDVV